MVKFLPLFPIWLGYQSNIYKDFQYICYGKIFKIEHLAGEGRGGGADSGPSKLAVYISFGGLLMKLAGDAKWVLSVMAIGLVLDTR